MKMCWGMNKDELRKVLAERTDLNECGYETLVKLTFETIYNSYVNYGREQLDLDKITVIDNGDYQGTRIFMIPFDTYQPEAGEYIMTYIGYGSCSGCDALQAAQGLSEGKLSDQQIVDFMAICKDLVANAIKPYNNGWREDKEWLPAEVEEVC
jgi:hypothetical protein